MCSSRVSNLGADILNLRFSRTFSASYCSSCFRLCIMFAACSCTQRHAFRYIVKFKFLRQQPFWTLLDLKYDYLNSEFRAYQGRLKNGRRNNSISALSVRVPLKRKMFRLPIVLFFALLQKTLNRIKRSFARLRFEFPKNSTVWTTFVAPYDYHITLVLKKANYGSQGGQLLYRMRTSISVSLFCKGFPSLSLTRHIDYLWRFKYFHATVMFPYEQL